MHTAYKHNYMLSSCRGKVLNKRPKRTKWLTEKIPPTRETMKRAKKGGEGVEERHTEISEGRQAGSK